jgi:hypothetical protein
LLYFVPFTTVTERLSVSLWFSCAAFTADDDDPVQFQTLHLNVKQDLLSAHISTTP